VQISIAMNVVETIIVEVNEVLNDLLKGSSEEKDKYSE